MYKENLRKLIILGIIGFVVGFVMAIAGELGFSGGCIMGLFLSGIVYGWKLSGKVVGGWIVIGSIPIMLIAFMLRLFLAIIVGWIAYPIMLIYTIIKVVTEK